MSAAAILAAGIGRALLRWARLLGKAILERLAKRAGPAAVDFFRKRSASFEKRRESLLPKLRAAKGKPGFRKLRRQHQAAMHLSKLFARFATWLEGVLPQVTPAAVKAYCAASGKVLERIPVYSRDEVACQD